MKNGGTGWRKIVMGVVAALLPLILRAINPEMPVEEIVVSVMGLLGAILGVAWQDAAKEKRAALESVNSPQPQSPETQE
jgi:hypothetical protein|tara:strand:+ start:3702 stop:3938 length:237 start_codon:yes stop_codon:yes gene_type:complete